MLSSLPMYDWPEMTEQTNMLWDGIAALLREHHLQPGKHLNRELESPELWTSGNCLFSQTCGWPLTEKYADALSIVGAPTYAIDGCEGYLNSSRIVCRSEDNRKQLKDFRNSRVAINAKDSQSGFQALKSALTSAQLASPFFQQQLLSGSHRNSLKLVSQNQADIASIDPVSWALATRYDEEVTKKLRVLAVGPYTPGLPFVCSKTFSTSIATTSFQEDLRQLIESDLEDNVRETLMLNGLSIPDFEDYFVLKELDSEAAQAGHDNLTTEQTH